MAGIPTPLDASALTRRITALENKVKTLEGARTLTAATISNGGLTIRDGGGLTIRDGGAFKITFREQDGARTAVLAGDVFTAESKDYLGTGLLVQRADGSDLLTAYSNPATGEQSLVIRDPQQSTVLWAGGAPRGLNAPTFSPHMSSVDYTTWGGVDGASWESVMEGGSRLYSARIRAQARATADTSGATGNVRLVVSYNGQDYQIGSTIDVRYAITSPLWEGDLPAAIPIGGYFVIKMQAQRTAGSGKIRGTVTQLLLGP